MAVRNQNQLNGEIRDREVRLISETGEMLGSMLGTIHNLRYYLRLTESMRDALDNGTFDAFVQDFYARRGLEVPPCPQD